MVLQVLRRPIGRATNICTRWENCSRKTLDSATRRWIGMKYLAKVAAAEDDWQVQASRIKAGKERAMLDILEERGLICQVTGSENDSKPERKID